MGRGRTLVLAAVAALGLSTLAPRVSEALSDMERFRVRSVEIEGMRFLDRAEVEATLALPPTASVWDDPTPWTARIAAHPLVRTVRVSRRLPSTLVVRLEERTPVALLASPTLEPVDAEGHVLPLDPALHHLDLPLLRVPPSAARRVSAPPRAPGASAGNLAVPGDEPDGWSADAPSRPLRVLSGEAARLAEAEPTFVTLLSELEWSRHDAVTARLLDPEVAIHFHAPVTPRRIREAMTVLADASARHPGRTVRQVDLRFADQVVVRYDNEGSP